MVITSDRENGVKPLITLFATNQGIPIVSLFCGPGGMDLGFRLEGFIPVLAIDDNEAAIATYNWNDRRKVAVKTDIRELSDREIVELVKRASSGIAPRGVIGGPPCQSFSLGNVRKKKRDPRARLGQEYARILKALNDVFQLDFFVFENVLGLKSPRHRRRFSLIRRAFERAGFDVFEQKLDASAFGVPQKRRRFFLIGFNKFKFPNLVIKPLKSTANTSVTVRDVLAHLPTPVFFKKDLKTDEIPFHPNHWAMNPKSPKFTNGYHQSTDARSFKRLAWDKPSWTVAYGNREVHIHPRGDRRISVLEAMLLQGFPKKYELRGTLSEQITQVSDAVPPPLAAAIASAIRNTIYRPIEKIQNKLLLWFKSNQRDFPWRRAADPFKTLVVEKLLQQTAATKAVTEAYKEITRRYPDAAALSRAPLQRLQRIISPLGFHYRASELKRLAKAIAARHAGAVPDELNDLLSLPGVGDYCARAVLVFGLKKDLPIVDTNVARFLYRVFGLRGPLPNNPARNKKLIQLAALLVPQGRARDFNLAVLDLCAALCTASSPECGKCPLRKECVFGRSKVAQTARERRKTAPINVIPSA